MDNGVAWKILNIILTVGVFLLSIIIGVVGSLLKRGLDTVDRRILKLEEGQTRFREELLKDYVRWETFSCFQVETREEVKTLRDKQVRSETILELMDRDKRDNRDHKE